MECIVKCEPPNDSFSSFDGTIKLHKLNCSSQSSSTQSSSTELIQNNNDNNDSNKSDNIKYTTIVINENESENHSSHHFDTPTKNIEQYKSFKAKAFDKELPICSNQILFRGSVLRNTNCVYAMTLYTGKNTRIFLNSKQTGLKFSSMEQRINIFLVIIITFNIILIALSIYVDVKNKRRQRKNRAKYFSFSHNYHWYIDKFENQTIFEDSIKSFFSFFSLYSYLVPLSIFVTLEGIRVLQTKFMEWDHRLMGKRIVTIHPSSGSKNINNTILNLDDDPNLPLKYSDSKKSITSSDTDINSLPKSNSTSTTTSKSNSKSDITLSNISDSTKSNKKKLYAKSIWSIFSWRKRHKIKKNNKIVYDSSKTLNQDNSSHSTLQSSLNEDKALLNDTTDSNNKSDYIPMQNTYKTITQVEWVPMKANSFNLGDDLGRVEFIFSDKTGTLTQNCMKLSKWCINGQIFDGAHNKECLSNVVHAKAESVDDFKMIDYIYEYCRAITTCNTVIPTLNHQNYHITYESQSPDEVALIQGLTQCGVRLLTHTKHDISVQVFENHEKFKIEILTEFSSDRKRMSILVKDKNNNYTLYCKGADDVIMERLSTDPNVNTEKIINSTKAALKEFGQSGLRCLVIAMRKFNQDEITQILEQYKIAENSIGNRIQNINKVVNSLEKHLKLLGVTAIEDQLQDQVPETIDYLIHVIFLNLYYTI